MGTICRCQWTNQLLYEVYTLCKRLVSSLFSRKTLLINENKKERIRIWEILLVTFLGWWKPWLFQRLLVTSNQGITWVPRAIILSPGAVVTIITVIWDVIQSSSRNFLLPLLKPQAMAPLWPSNIPCVCWMLFQPRVWIRSNKPEDKTTQLDPPQRFNMEPENAWFRKGISFPSCWFRFHVKLPGV